MSGVTYYSQENQAFSDRCHLLARRIIYPKFFGCGEGDIVWETCSVNSDNGGRLDGELAIDRIARIIHPEFRYPVSKVTTKRGGVVKVDHIPPEPIKNTIQERFNHPKHDHYKHITITEFNKESRKWSELYKITSGWFVYGYPNSQGTDFSDLVIVSVPRLLRVISSLKFDRLENDKRQIYMRIPFEQLGKHGLIEFRYQLGVVTTR